MWGGTWRRGGTVRGEGNARRVGVGREGDTRNLNPSN